jgi:hypothetical protein
MREQQNRFRVVIDLVLGETRLVVVDQRDDVPAGHVAKIDNGEAGRVEIEANGVDAAARKRRTNSAAIEHPGEGQVIDVPGRASHLGVGVLPADIAPNHSHDSRDYYADCGVIPQIVCHAQIPQVVLSADATN